MSTTRPKVVIANKAAVHIPVSFCLLRSLRQVFIDMTSYLEIDLKYYDLVQIDLSTRRADH